MYDYAYQWESIIGSNIFSEPARLTDDDTFCVDIHGIYFSGSYAEESPAAYAPKQSVEKYGFQLSRRELPESMEFPEEALPGAHLHLLDPKRYARSVFRVLSVEGADGDLLMLRLQPGKDVEHGGLA